MEDRIKKLHLDGATLEIDRDGDLRIEYENAYGDQMTLYILPHDIIKLKEWLNA